MNTFFRTGSLCAAVLGAALAFTAPPIQPAQAQNRNLCQSWFRMVQTRDGDPLNLREYPNGPIVDVVPDGSEVLFNTGDRTGDWAEITLKGGKTGWVADRYLGRHAADAAEHSGQWKIKTLDGDSVVLRSGAARGNKAIAALKPGQVINEIEYVGYWMEVKTLEGDRGFVSTQFLVCR